MVKRWINTRGPALTGAPNGDWIKWEDYQSLQAALKEALGLAERAHYYCEDGWYSCPRAEDGCLNENAGDECNCGVDKTNKRITELRKQFLEEA